MSEVGEKFVFAEELSGENREKDSVREVRSLLEESVRSDQARAERKSLPISPEFSKCVGGVKGLLEGYFSSFGIKNVNLSAKVVKVPDSGGALGASTWGIVEVSDRKISDRDLKLYEEAKILAHELYHYSGNYTLSARRSETGEIVGFTNERSGLTYRRLPKSAVEEGLALAMELRIDPLLRLMFMEGAKKRDEILEDCVSKHPEQDAATVKLFGEVFSEGSGEYEVRFQKYAPSLDFVAYLSREIPDFLRLAERARVLGETLPLARAIEDRFGSGSYKDVMTTTNENAGLRRKWLERKHAGQKEH